MRAAVTLAFVLMLSVVHAQPLPPPRPKPQTWLSLTAIPNSNANIAINAKVSDARDGINLLVFVSQPGTKVTKLWINRGVLASCPGQVCNAFLPLSRMFVGRNDVQVTALSASNIVSDAGIMVTRP